MNNAQAKLIPLIFVLLQTTTYSETDKNQESDSDWESYSNYGSYVNDAKDVTNQTEVKDITEHVNEYRYASFEKPDPFIPPLISTHLAKIEIPIISVLQRFHITELRVVGIWSLESKERKALVMTPKNEGVIVKIGSSIGNRGGKIIQISYDTVKVREFTLAPDGTRVFEDFELWLGSKTPDKNNKIIIESRPVKQLTLPNNKKITRPASDLEPMSNEPEYLKRAQSKNTHNLNQATVDKIIESTQKTILKKEE